MLKEDIESSDDVVFDDMNEHVVMAQVSVIVLHVIAVLFGQSIVSFNSGAEYFKTLIQSFARNCWALPTEIIFEVCMSHPAKAAFRSQMITGEDKLLGIVNASAVT